MAAVDWGTTRLRIWLLDADGNVLGERRSDEGLMTVGPGPDRFGPVLEAHLGALGAPAGLAAVVCGMAGARQGWVEAPYVSTPASVGAIADGAVAVPGARRPVYILPGVAQRSPDAPDVMRGEETQIAGIARDLAGRERLVCLPGTHSKWVHTKDAAIAGYRTFLTGELFSLLADHSILRDTLGDARRVAPDSPAFRDALLQTLRDPAALSARLFSIRAGGLLNGLSAGDAAATLSGLLIGTEIASATAALDAGDAGSVILLASGPLGALYAKALTLGGITVEIADADGAARAGLLAAARHLGILSHHDRGTA
ncbi:2-dehydro-3-deoxygalactonokinase [Mesorhizobium xinjiangense]|uniref:2-dehydro-3-deoxygalactonokinase n=1 Tax=Mesorhizobium xinjiangense TaxID=2678685 RepID=UPI0012EE654F|nr:2-dehydro-3-deoxygalactonokinase [Mesorhizobium xinjiangense]